MDKRKTKASKKGKDIAKKKTIKQTNKKNVKNNRSGGSGNSVSSLKKPKAICEDGDVEIVPEVSSTAIDGESHVTPIKVGNSMVNGGEITSPNTLKFFAARVLECLRLQLSNSVQPADGIGSTHNELNFGFSNGVIDHTDECINEIPSKRRLKKKVIILGDDDDNPELPEICLGDEFSIPNSGNNKDVEAGDSDSTINYDINEFMSMKAVTTTEVISKSPEQSFSPIPSTSRNEKVFEQNDIIYEKCILQSKANMTSALKVTETIKVEKARTPSPTVKIETEVFSVNSQLPDSSQDNENKTEAFDKLLEQIDLEESDHDDVVVVNVDDVIQENKALFKKFKSEKNPKPESPLQSNFSNTENQNLKSLLDITPKEEVVIDEDEIETRIKKREQEMSNIVTNYFKHTPLQTPIVINDSHDDIVDQCTSTSDDSDLLSTIVKYIASTQLVKKTKALMDQAFESTGNKTTHRKRVNRIAGSCQIIDFVNLDNYSPVKTSKAFEDEIIILDDSDTVPNDNCNNTKLPPTSINSENSPSTSSCHTSTPLIQTQSKRKSQSKRKRKSNVINLNDTVDNTPKKARVENTSLNETEGTPRRNIGDCPICLEALSAKPISSTVCGHIFCLTCIQTIMKTSKRCPTCRKALRGAKAYHPIFL